MSELDKKSISTELTFFDDESTREKLTVLDKIEAMVDDDRNWDPEFYAELHGDFLEPGKRYRLTIEEIPGEIPAADDGPSQDCGNDWRDEGTPANVAVVRALEACEFWQRAAIGCCFMGFLSFNVWLIKCDAIWETAWMSLLMGAWCSHLASEYALYRLHEVKGTP
jgi:hypothetical protein